MFSYRQHSGVTLIELILYVAIAALMFGALTSFLIVSLDARVRAHTVVRVSEDIARAQLIVEQYVERAAAITEPVAGERGDALVLAMPGDDAPEVTIAVASSTLTLTAEGADPVALTGPYTRVDAVIFDTSRAAIAPAAVRFGISASRAGESERFSYRYSSSATSTIPTRIYDTP